MRINEDKRLQIINQPTCESIEFNKQLESFDLRGSMLVVGFYDKIDLLSAISLERNKKSLKKRFRNRGTNIK